MLNFKKIGKKNICLTGLMGSGKSVIGRELSKIYDIEFFDSDKEIEKKIGKSINLIFKERGELYFRKVEEEICLKILGYDNCVVSLGGGSVTSLKIRNFIKKNSLSIYLKVDIDTLSNRLTKNISKRPLLNVSNKKEILKKIYLDRKNFYNDALIIIENNFDKKEVIKKISNKLKKYE